MDREELMQNFGPKLIDGFLQVFLEEINLIRSEISLPARTEAEIIGEIGNKINPQSEEYIGEYEWE